MAINKSPTAAHVIPRNWFPRVAETPMFFPCRLIRSTNFMAMTVAMADEVPRAMNPSYITAENLLAR